MYTKELVSHLNKVATPRFELDSLTHLDAKNGNRCSLFV